MAIPDTTILEYANYLLLNASAVEDTGLALGKAGICLALFEVADLLKQEDLKERATRLLGDCILLSAPNLSFKTGWAGIIYAVRYLQHRRLLEIEFEEIFHEYEVALLASIKGLIQQDEREGLLEAISLEIPFAEDTYRQHDIFATAFINEVAPEMKSSPGIGSGASDIGSGGVDDQRISHAFESGFISFDTSMKENPALSYMLMTCIQKIPQLQSLLAGYLNGTAGKLTFKLEELASGIVMETRSDAIGQTTEIIINSFYVDDNGFNYVMTGTSNNAGFNFGNETNADANTTFVGNLTHEAMHARHIAAYNEAMEYAVNSGTLDPFSVARQYLLNKGYSSEFTDIFFIEKNGKWSKTDEKTFDKREHEYIKKYNQGVFNNAMNQWGALY